MNIVKYLLRDADDSTFFDHQSGAFFRPIDWAAFAVCLLVTLAVYVYGLAPTVTLEDSGELAVASDYLGVPHPPGYPIWTLLTWFFQWVFHFVKYNGQPNPAWSVGLASAVTGACACGLLALLVSRSGSDMLRSIKAATRIIGTGTENAICWTSGVSAGLLFAFSPVLWSQSTIVEVYSLNALFMMLIIVFFYYWMERPHRQTALWWASFLFAIGLTNHQSLVFIGPMLAIGVLVKDWRLFRAFLGVGLFYMTMLLLNGAAAKLGQDHTYLCWNRGWDFPAFWWWTAYLVVVPALAIPLLSWQKSWARITAQLLAVLNLGVIAAALPVVRLKPEMLAQLAEAGRTGQFGAPVSYLSYFPTRPSPFDLSVGLFVFNALVWAVIIAVLWLLLHVALRAACAALEKRGFEGILPAALRQCRDDLKPAWSYAPERIAWRPEGTVVGVAFLLVLLGLSFNFFMPISSEQNPPINWGYPRTWEGFVHAITRGQYEKISPVDNFRVMMSDLGRFARQIHAIVTDPFNHFSVAAQFTGLVSLLAVIPLFFVGMISKKTLLWLITTFVGFLSLTLIFIVFQDPKFDVQTLFIMRVQYIQAHAVFALWIGYGLALLLAFIDTLARGNRIAKNAGLVVALALPLILLHRNAHDEQFIKIHGSCDLRGHSFGWQFGNWQLRGVNGIRDDLRYWLSPEEFEQAWAEYPTPDYPPEMGEDAIFFGGTDPGRFVPTYMIYSAHVRPDVFLITQNALADNTYMNVMRDLMGNDIWIPSQTDSNLAFQQYVSDIQSGNIPAGADVTFQDGRVSVQGVQGVMMINGILCKMIFEHNKHKHPFYVEESYVIPWMYPYMTPHGLILKINNDPLDELPADLVEKDHKFWEWYTGRLLGDRRFLRDVVARKTFSKLRSAIAGLYAYRQMHDEAEYAFRQSIDLYPLSPEANFRLADILMQRRHYTQAVEVIEKFLDKDKGNERVAEFRDQIRQAEGADRRRVELEARFHSGQQVDVQEAFELAQIYRMLNMMPMYEQMTRSIVFQDGLPPEITLQVAQLHAASGQTRLLEEALRRYLARVPANWHVWVDLAAVQFSLNRQAEALESVRKAIEFGGAEARDRMRTEETFNPVRGLPEFQRLVPVVQPTLNLPVRF